MDLEKYKNDGWGISLLGFEKLLSIIVENKEEEIRILEFGSGRSTKFFCDVHNEKIKKLDITSFDNDLNYCYVKKDEDTCLNLLIRPLIECNDNDYLKQFNDKKYNHELMSDKKTPLEPTQKNNFYKIEENDLNGYYDIVLLDGPSGNGRNFAFLQIKNYLKDNSIIYIDDYNHYDFLERCLDIFDCEILFKHTEGIGGDNFVIVKIIKK